MADNIVDKGGKPKSGKRAARDAAFFFGGFFTGAACTVAVGVLTDNIDPHNLSLGAGRDKQSGAATK